MVKRNKELELEALKEIMKQDKESKPEDEEKLKLASLEAERAVKISFLLRSLFLRKFNGCFNFVTISS